ncbi:V-type ATPase subunit [Facklamia sp. DSM 111018]|uniref:V-type ATPase subunit n=1 Tax=Facklamia lactis TaxID=2749967 RepID=A0ABS0LQZ4_9LACT|nr:V-type ATPase subunit [Facklamia lactis]MBG9980610.1 V-type ATPase subunit [Facklamia lactis]MBG9986424.1 V-type ATPase subunit [Facklamia lactis]
MTELAYSGLNTTLRLYEAQLLTHSDYDTMLQMDSVDNVLDYLSKSAYVVTDDAKRERNFEPILQQRLELVYRELLEACPDPRVIEIFSLKYTYHNLKLLIKQTYLNVDCEHLLIPIGSYSIDQLKQVVESKGVNEDLHPILQQAVYDAITSVEDTNDIFSIEVIMDTAYLHHIRENAEEINHPDVLRFTKMKIDFQNLLTFVRAYNQGQSKSFVFAALSDQGAVSRDDIIENWRNQDLNGLVDSYQTAEYMINLDPIWDQLHNQTVNPTENTAVIQKEFSEILRSYSFEPFGPMPVLTYLYFLENELDNVRLILIGKENQLDSSLIKERMRPIHGI